MRRLRAISRRDFLASAAVSTATALRAQSPARDLILVNGRIHTMDARASVVSSVTIRDGRIAAAGNTPQRNLVPSGTRVIDLRGRTVVPGLIESHVHGMDMAMRPGYHMPQVESTASIRDLQETLAAHRKTVPEGQWITAIGGWNTNQWAEHRYPTLKELDDAVPDLPVFLFEGFNGAAITNTAGKKFFDAADAGPLPHPDYQKVNVSASGAIAASNSTTGGPSTSALYLLRRMQTFEDKRRNALATMQYSASLGVTSWLDKSTIYALGPLHPRQGSANVDPYRVYDPWNALHREGRMTIRIQFDFTAFAEIDPENRMLREYLRNQFPFFGDDMFRTGGIGEWAAPLSSGAQWRAAQRIVAQAGWRNDNSAGNLANVRQIVDEYEAVNKEIDITGLRWSMNLNGGDTVDTALLTRLKALGSSVQMCSFQWVRSTDSKVVAGPAFRTVADHGIRAGLMGNGTHISPLNPWLHLHYVTTGVNLFGAQVNPGQQLTREEALRFRTRENSWLLRMEDRLGSIEPGKLADLAVLDRDYFSIPGVEIKKIRPVLTIVDGKVVHESAA